MDNLEQERNDKKIQIDMNNDLAQGVYSNVSMSNFNAEEIVLDFLYIQPNIAKGSLRSRVILSPKHIKRLQALINRTVSDYETKCGPIQSDDDADSSSIKFSVN